ncbi:hypothetical protein F1559_001233 [Cyanidiococcus yangmingshanensis]|uniref:Membrane insertase YidC/Oxa/ALB C-terminal domain-containing protein n=1 Tax=Cyanidiococcus yangmingshanensis TaxID=2690220 RepID=A0A7J7IHB4_9RHOD|nr:hypothetical protein F1559_001233 [Cyanidiococcus yangmingshanensis]
MLHRLLPRIARRLSTERKFVGVADVNARAALLEQRLETHNGVKCRAKLRALTDDLQSLEAVSLRASSEAGRAADEAHSTKPDDVSTTPGNSSDVTENVSSNVSFESEVGPILSDANWYDPVVQGIIMLHECTGLPWWATVAAATALARLLVLPLTLNTFQNSARMQSIKPDLDAIKERMQIALQTGDQHRSRSAQQEIFRLLRENRISPFRSLVNPLVQMPLFIAFFFALRKMARIYPDELKQGGLAWFRDLAAPDPFYGLPALTSATMLIMIQIGAETGGGQLPKVALNMMRVFALGLVPLTAHFPAILFCYWLPSNFFSVLQAYFFRFQHVRRWLGCPPLGHKAAAIAPNSSDPKASQSDPTESAIRSYLKTNNSSVSLKGSELRLLKNPPRKSSKAS